MTPVRLGWIFGLWLLVGHACPGHAQVAGASSPDSSVAPFSFADGAADSLRLSTYAWDYAPWLRRFAKVFREFWIAPVPYRLGLVSGDVSVRLQIDPSGEFTKIEVADNGAHASLKNAAVEALRATSGFMPLSAEFKEDSLTMDLVLHYPQARAR